MPLSCALAWMKFGPSICTMKLFTSVKSSEECLCILPWNETRGYTVKRIKPTRNWPAMKPYFLSCIHLSEHHAKCSLSCESEHLVEPNRQPLWALQNSPHTHTHTLRLSIEKPKSNDHPLIRKNPINLVVASKYNFTLIIISASWRNG